MTDLSNPAVDPTVSGAGVRSAATDPALRIVGWNCNGKLRAKASRLLELGPDIAVVSECAHDVDALGDLRLVGWTGTLEKKGLGVFARPEFGGRVDPTHDESRQYFLPVRFEALDFALVAVWAMNHRGKEARPAYGRTHDAIEHYGGFLAATDLVIGDFNDNIRWDKPKKPAFATTTRLLVDAGFANLYYLWTGEAPGSESVGSLYFYRHADKPYLIDHAFLRRDRLGDVRDFTLGEPGAWLSVSDHVPLVVDLALPAIRPAGGASGWNRISEILPVAPRKWLHTERLIDAALLHDAIEDVHHAPGARETVAAFGPEVLRIVEVCTDADTVPKPPWRERKEASAAADISMGIREMSPSGVTRDVSATPRACASQPVGNSRSGRGTGRSFHDITIDI